MARITGASYNPPDPRREAEDMARDVRDVRAAGGAIIGWALLAFVDAYRERTRQQAKDAAEMRATVADQGNVVARALEEIASETRRAG